jgi:hypothetical protein
VNGDAIVEFGRTHYLTGSQAVYNMQEHNSLIPVIIALIIAVVGQGIILFGDFGPGSQPHVDGTINSAAVTRAGAIERPAAP